MGIFGPQPLMGGRVGADLGQGKDEFPEREGQEPFCAGGAGASLFAGFGPSFSRVFLIRNQITIARRRDSSFAIQFFVGFGFIVGLA